MKNALQVLDALLAFEEQELEAREARYRAQDDKAWLLHAAKRRQIAIIRDWIAALSAGKTEFFGGVSRGADYLHIHGEFPSDGNLEIGAAVAGELAADLRAGRKFYAVSQLEANEFAVRVLGGVAAQMGVGYCNNGGG